NRLNTQVQSFPDNVIAGTFNFKKEQFFKIEDDSERNAPEVKF
ncbi:MAG: LemA family protein, partial [Candidatus Omnitrophica bacterium]|nr:LemA family protein [Candidatus Omnitrophota bacterium]